MSSRRTPTSSTARLRSVQRRTLVWSSKVILGRSSERCRLRPRSRPHGKKKCANRGGSVRLRGVMPFGTIRFLRNALVGFLASTLAASSSVTSCLTASPVFLLYSTRLHVVSQQMRMKRWTSLPLHNTEFSGLSSSSSSSCFRVSHNRLHS